EIFRRRYGNEDIRLMFVHFTLWSDYYHQGDIQRALAHLEEGLKRHPRESNLDLAFLSLWLGERHAARGEYQEAVLRLRQASVSMFGETAPLAPHSSLIRVLCVKGDYEEAKSEAEGLARTLDQIKPREEGSFVDALTAVGLGFSKAGHQSRAESYLRKALTIGGRFMFEN